MVLLLIFSRSHVCGLVSLPDTSFFFYTQVSQSRLRTSLLGIALAQLLRDFLAPFGQVSHRIGVLSTKLYRLLWMYTIANTILLRIKQKLSRCNYVIVNKPLKNAIMYIEF